MTVNRSVGRQVGYTNLNPRREDWIKDTSTKFINKQVVVRSHRSQKHVEW